MHIYYNVNTSILSICDKKCNIHFDVNERLVVVEIRLKCRTRANYIFKEVLIHLVVDLMVYLMIIYAVGDHRYCLGQCVTYCPLLIPHSNNLYTRYYNNRYCYILYPLLQHIGCIPLR